MSKLKSIVQQLEILEDSNSDLLSGGFLIVSSSSIIGGTETNTNCGTSCTNNCKGGNCVVGCGSSGGGNN